MTLRFDTIATAFDAAKGQPVAKSPAVQPAEAKKIRKLYEQKKYLSPLEIETKSGRSWSTITRLAVAAAEDEDPWTRTPRPAGRSLRLSAAQMRELKRKYEHKTKYISDAELAKEYGLTPSGLGKRAKAEGWKRQAAIVVTTKTGTVLRKPKLTKVELESLRPTVEKLAIAGRNATQIKAHEACAPLSLRTIQRMLAQMA